MTLTQRLTRAGATFIVFGTAALMIPTDGNAFSATDTCTIPAQKDYVGDSATDTAGSYALVGGTRSLTAYPANGVSAQTVSDGNTADFTTTRSGNQVTTMLKAGASTGTTDLVTVTFSDGHIVTYTVTQQ